jgi:hypothetical protein
MFRGPGLAEQEGELLVRVLVYGVFDLHEGPDGAVQAGLLDCGRAGGRF